VVVVFLAPMIDLPSGTIKERLTAASLAFALLVGSLVCSLPVRVTLSGMAFHRAVAAPERGSLQSLTCTRRC
jgi:hypothetical protein